MFLFDNRERFYTGPAEYSESHFDYLQRSAKPAFEDVRALMEDWLSRFPRVHRQALISRLTTNDDLQFEAAFFKLYLHELFQRLRFRVQVHPRRTKRRKRPDFRLFGVSGLRLLVEAVTVADTSTKERAATGRLAQAYDALNKLISPDFFLHVEHFGLPNTPIAGRKLRNHVQTWLKSVDYEAVRKAAAVSLFSGIPKTTFVHDGCRLDIQVLPVRGDARGNRDHRPVGMTGPGEAQWANHWVSLRDAIRKKATRYGRLRQPYVIAVNAADQHLDMIHIMEALFGQETFVFRRHPDPARRKGEFVRRPNGAWISARGPINTRVSAVLVVSSLLPWTVGVHQPGVYYNPWARYPLVGAFPSLTGYVPEEDHMKRVDGPPIREVFGLSEGWPRGLVSASQGAVT